MKGVLAIWWLVMTRVSYWWMRTNLTLTMMKLDVVCLLAHLYFHVVIHSGKVSWGPSGTCRYWRCYMEPKLWFVQYDDKIWSGNTVKGIQAQQGWNCIDIQVGTIVERNVCWKCLQFQLPWLKWTWAKTISSLQVRSQVQQLNWYSPPILARLIFWCGGNKMEVDKLVCYAFGALVIPRQGPIL